MLTAPLAVSLLALSAALATPLVPSASAHGTAALAQAEAAAEASPVVEDPPAGDVTLPEGAREVPPKEEASGPRARMRERRKQREADAEGLDPILTTALQVGAGVGTCGVCTLGYCGLSLVIGGPLGLVLTPLGLPLVTALVTGAIDAALCGAVGLSVGSVQALVGNQLGSEEGSLLWPALAGAGIGVGASAVGTLVSLALPLTGYEPLELKPGDTSVALDDLVAVSNPAALALQALTLGACVLGCVAMPIVPVLVYSLVAEPKATLRGTASELESGAPAPSPSRMAMAY